LKNNTDLTILPADKGNATVILNTADYKQKIISILEDPAYRRLTRDPTGIRQNEKPHYCLKNPLSQKIYANNYVHPAPDPKNVWTSKDS
jgi:hypothetical protein